MNEKFQDIAFDPELFDGVQTTANKDERYEVPMPISVKDILSQFKSKDKIEHSQSFEKPWVPNANNNQQNSKTKIKENGLDKYNKKSSRSLIASARYFF